MLSGGARRLVDGSGARINVLAAAADEGKGNVRLGDRDDEAGDGGKVAHDDAVGDGTVEGALGEQARYVLGSGRNKVHADALAKGFCELGRVDDLVFDYALSKLGQDSYHEVHKTRYLEMTGIPALLIRHGIDLRVLDENVFPLVGMSSPSCMPIA
jgi:hypothetical protein